MQEVARPAPPALSLYLFPLLLSLSLSPFYPPVPCGPTGPGPGRRTGARRLVCVRVWKRDEGRHHESVRAQGGAGLGRSTGLRLAFPSLSPRSPSGPIRSGLSASAYLSNRAPAARAGEKAAVRRARRESAKRRHLLSLSHTLVPRLTRGGMAGRARCRGVWGGLDAWRARARACACACGRGTPARRAREKNAQCSPSPRVSTRHHCAFFPQTRAPQRGPTTYPPTPQPPY